MLFCGLAAIVCVYPGNVSVEARTIAWLIENWM
jgi:hypothetical protein